MSFKAQTKRRPPKRSKKSVDKKQSQQIAQLKKQVAKLTNADEKKWYDFNQNSKPVTTAGFIQPLLGLDVWAGSNEFRHKQREGNTLVITSLKMDGEAYIDKDFAAPDSNNIIRLILVQMLDDCHDAPVITDILDDATPTYNSFYKIKGNRRYKIHYDKRFFLQNTNQTYSSSSAIMPTTTEPFRKRFLINANIPKTGLKVEYRQGSISGNGPVKNGLYLVGISDSAIVSHPAIIYKSRMRFLDN